jgi:tRNA(Ile)-lysidine synthase
MAATTTPRPKRVSALPNPALAPLQGLSPALPVAVAFSGGADSTALLLAAATTWPGQVHAIHIHHGLQAAADDFARHCETVCAGLNVPLHQARVDARNEPGESPEDAARKARYAALAEAAKTLGMKSVWLAQHADDQVETMLLALSRGAGLPGLAAMPQRFLRNGMQFERPLLGTSGAAIRAWLAGEGVSFIDDPTNADTAFTRNRIRHELLPALEKAFPQFRDTFARSARHAAQAQELLAALAVDDLAVVGNPPVIRALRKLSRPRQANALRHWLRTAHQCAASAAQMEELLDQVDACATRGHDIRIKVGTGFVQRNGDSLRFSI